MPRVDDLSTDPELTAGDFRGIPFASWLDLMLEYAVLLARTQDSDKAYEVMNIAKGANVFYSSVDSMFLIHLCWFSRKSSVLLDLVDRLLTCVQHVL